MFDKLRDVIAEQTGVDSNSIQPNTSFLDDLDMDSLELFELIMAIEDAFSLEISSDEVSGLDTVEDVMEYLKAQGIEA